MQSTGIKSVWGFTKGRTGVRGIANKGDAAADPAM